LSLGPRLELRQGQGLVITPQLQQAIKLLQLSNIELEAFVEAELERNPLLQRDAEPEAEPDAPKVDRTEAAADEMPDGAATADMDGGHEELSPGERDSGEGGEAADGGGAIDWSRAGKGGSFESEDDFEGRLSREKTLAEHLHDQLAVAGLTEAERGVAAVLIDAVDEGGYLRADLVEIGERLGCGLSFVEGWACSTASSRPASWPATCANACRCSCATRTGWIRPWTPCWPTSTSWPGATWRA
jgi:RNA polymerase sigma-54 factor